MILLIDNYDSFTYNLLHYLGEAGASVEVVRNDQISAEAAVARAPEAIVLSPGPCDPDKAGICMDLIRLAAGKIPLFGVCLGHQCIGQVYGAKIVRAPVPMHGKISEIHHRGTDVFTGLPSPFKATRYHSLTIDPATVPDCLEVTARTEDGVIMGVAHKQLPVWGVQFHPESIATDHGHRILENFLRLAKTGAPVAA